MYSSWNGKNKAHLAVISAPVVIRKHVCYQRYSVIATVPHRVFAAQSVAEFAQERTTHTRLSVFCFVLFLDSVRIGRVVAFHTQKRAGGSYRSGTTYRLNMGV